MRTMTSIQIFLLTATPALFFGCEQQDPPVRAADQAVEDAPSETGSNRSPALPGSTGYYNALSGAKGVADNTKKKADDYNRKLEEQMDDLFTD